MTNYDLLFLIVIICIFLCYKKYIGYRNSKRLNKISLLGKKEQELIEIIETEKKYKIKEINPELSVCLEEGGKSYFEQFKYPLIVRKNNKDYLLKIKKDKDAIRFSSSRYRRELLTECAIFSVQGIIIIDASGRFREFSVNIPKRKNYILKLLLYNLLFLMLLTYILFRFIK